VLHLVIVNKKRNINNDLAILPSHDKSRRMRRHRGDRKRNRKAEERGSRKAR